MFQSGLLDYVARDHQRLRASAREFVVRCGNGILNQTRSDEIIRKQSQAGSSGCRMSGKRFGAITVGTLALAMLLCARASTFAAGVTNSSARFSLPAKDSSELAWWRDSMQNRDTRLQWWREARFGMFVHWGVYSELGGIWHGKAVNGYAEHIQRKEKIPIPVYREEVAGKFNPLEFDADKWIKTAREAGMGYFIITAKHHDGFAMWDSRVNDYNIVKATPFHRDPMKELRAACKKHGIRFGFYYSHAFDWGEADAPGNDWDYDNPGGDKQLHGGRNWWLEDPEFVAKARRYVDEKAIPQLLELIRNYDPDILWFDTPQKLPDSENLRILRAVRAAKPDIVVNGRLVRGLGDYASTTDRPSEFPPHEGDWEGIPTTNESYGWNQNDHSHKPPEHFVRLLAKAAARGGNVLMNVGPMGNGEMDPKDMEILRGIGRWWSVNGESIRGTRRTPLAVQAWGESTRKGNRLYLHIFAWPGSGRLVVGGLKSEVEDAYLLGDPRKASLKTARLNSLDLGLEVPIPAPDAMDSVLVLDCQGEIKTDPTRLLQPEVKKDVLRAFDGELRGGGLKFGPGKKTDDHVEGWERENQSVAWPVRLDTSAEYEVSINYDAPERSEGGTYAMQVGPRMLVGTVKAGTGRSESLGRVSLAPGAFEILMSPKHIEGSELMRLRAVILTSVEN